MNQAQDPREPRLLGCLLGTAVGDSIGLPMEGISRRRAARMFPGPLCQRLLLDRGMISDDTEHTLFVVDALARSGVDPVRFARSLGWHLRFWVLGIPAGVGFATLRACIRLWIGFPPTRSGVWSAGNGAAMRSAITGVWAGDDYEKMTKFVRASTLVTHRDPRAYHGALAVALAASRPWADFPAYCEQLAELLPRESDTDEFWDLLHSVSQSLVSGTCTTDFATSMGWGRGITGYVYHTVPVALHASFGSPDDFRAALESAIRCGGDTDTVGAITGAIVGAWAPEAIPSEWVSGILEWPRSVRAMGCAATTLAKGDGALTSPALMLLLSLPRNLFFLLIVLFHAGRRLFPPY